MLKNFNELELLCIQVMKDNSIKNEKNLRENFAYYGFDDDFLVDSLVGDCDSFLPSTVKALQKRLGDNEKTGYEIMELFAKENKLLIDNTLYAMKHSKNHTAEDIYHIMDNEPYSKENISYTLCEVLQYTSSKMLFELCTEKDMEKLSKVYSPFSMKTGAAKSFDEGQYIHLNAGQEGIGKLLEKIDVLSRETALSWNKNPKNTVLEKRKTERQNNKNMEYKESER